MRLARPAERSRAQTGGQFRRASAASLVSIETGGAEPARARWLCPDRVLSLLDRAAVARLVAGGRRSFRHHVSNGAAHVAPHACGFLTATKAEGEPERKRERADDPYEQDVDERRGDPDLRRSGDDAEAKGRPE